MGGAHCAPLPGQRWLRPGPRPGRRGGIWRWSSAVGCACEEEGLGQWCSRAAGPTQPDRIRSRLGVRVSVPSQVGRAFPELGPGGTGGGGAGGWAGAPEANADVSVQLQLLAPTCLDPEPAPGPPPRHEQMTPAYLQPRYAPARLPTCPADLRVLTASVRGQPEVTRPEAVWDPGRARGCSPRPLRQANGGLDQSRGESGRRGLHRPMTTQPRRPGEGAGLTPWVGVPAARAHVKSPPPRAGPLG